MRTILNKEQKMRNPSRRTTISTLCIALAAAATLSACGGGDQNASAGGPPVVVATTTQIADLVRQIGGPDVAVHQVLQPNSDPHEYEPRPSDAQTAAGARLIVTSGLGLDAWAEDLTTSSGSDATTVDVGASVPAKLRGSGDEAGRTDPHWWHDPRNFLAASTTVEQALSTAAPDATARIAKRAQAYRLRLTKLDAALRSCFDKIPPEERKVVTDHDAFSYLLKRYGITYVGAVIPSQSTKAQASAGELAALEDTIRRQNVKAVFPESSVNAQPARRIATDTGASADYTLYGDTLGPKDGPASTYIGMEEANANALVRGMTGDRQDCAISE
jgi:zinc/manganese transport system substrate-binding protein